MTDQDFQKFLDKIILKKRWDEIRDNWLTRVTKIHPPGSPLEEDLTELVAMTEICERLVQNDNEDYIIEDADFVRNYVLREAIFSLHKSANIISNTQNSLLKGYKTWSLVNGYHGSFIAARSIISFFGVSNPVLKLKDGKSNLTIIDCWPSLIQPKEKRKQLNLGSNNSVIFANPQITKFDQRHIWMILQRFTKVITIEEKTWSRDYLKIINSIDFKNFGRQRNYLFYSNNSWLFDDLHEFVIEENFGLFNKKFIDDFRENQRELKSDFSVCISLLLIKMAFSLFTELSSKTRLLEGEYDLLNSCLTSEEKHPLYLRSFSS